MSLESSGIASEIFGRMSALVMQVETNAIVTAPLFEWADQPLCNIPEGFLSMKS